MENSKSNSSNLKIDFDEAIEELKNKFKKK